MAEPSTPTTATTTAPDTSGERPILVWDAQEFATYDREKHWYLVVGAIGLVIAVGAIIYGIFSGNLRDMLSYGLMAVVFVLATFVVLRHADDKPRTITYGITKLGIQVGDKFHPYNELRSFWIIYKPPIQTMTLQGTSRFKPLVKADLAGVDPLKVKTVLKEYLPEEPKQSEDFLDKFSRMIRL